jgi:hypothetical protein
MAAAFLPLAIFAGIRSGSVTMMAGLAGLGAVVSIALGYMYVAIVLMMRRMLSPGIGR